MEMRAAVARCSVPCFRMTFDHNVVGMDDFGRVDGLEEAPLDAVMRWIQAGLPQSTFANLECAQLFGLDWRDFVLADITGAETDASSGSAAQPLMFLHSDTVRGVTAQLEGMKATMAQLLQGDITEADVDKSALPNAVMATEASRSGQVSPQPVACCPVEAALPSMAMLTAPKGGLQNVVERKGQFDVATAAAYIGLEWWLPPGWAPDTMRRTVQEGLTAAKVAQQWPRMRLATCYVLDSEKHHAEELVTGVALSMCTASKGGQPQAALRTGVCEGMMQAGAGEAFIPASMASVPAATVSESAEVLLQSLLASHPDCFQGSPPTSNGAMAAVLTSYMKSLFVLTRAAGEAVIGL